MSFSAPVIFEPSQPGFSDNLNATVTALAAYTDGRLNGLPVNLGEYDMIAGSTSSDAKAANVTGLTAAINDANARGSSIFAPEGIYYFTTNHVAFPVLSAAVGITGVPGKTFFEFNKDGDCIVSKGPLKKFDGLYMTNRATSYAALSAVLRAKNCAYGEFANLFIASEHANAVGLMIEHVYDAGAADANFIAHLGCWYNNLRNINIGYLTVGVNIGHGLSLRVDSSAVGVVNPPGQTAGTYTGSVIANTTTGLNIEGKARGLNLDKAHSNVFIGGQFLGCADQVYGVDADANTFLNTKHNQWTGKAFNLDPAQCHSNAIINPGVFNTGSAPWSLGTIGTQPMVLATDEAVTEHGLTLHDLRISRPTQSDSVQFTTPGGAQIDLMRPDASAAALRLGNGSNIFFGEVAFYNAAGSQNYITVDAGNGTVNLKEVSAPPAAASDSARLFARDNGSGKTQICAVFSSGAVQVIATQP